MDPALSQRLTGEMEAERQREHVPEGFPSLPGISADRYVDPIFFALEQEYLFPRQWQLVAHASELPELGSYVLSDEVGSPLVVVRGDDDVVRAFYNACQHRGAAVVREAAGCVHAFRCPYHGWTYGLDGHLRGRPDERDFNERRPGAGLVELRCETWGGWIFVNRSASGPSLLDNLGSIPAQMESLRVDELVQVDKRSLTLACNWKVVVEAFLEVYHLAHIHPNTAGALLEPQATTIGLLPGGHSRMVSRKQAGREHGGFKSTGMHDIEGASEILGATSFSFHLFPNLVTPLDTAGFPFLFISPIDIRSTRLDVRWFGPPWAGERPPGWKDVLDLFDLVMAEDTRNLAWIQKSLESDGFSQLQLSYQERRIYHFHEAIDRAIGVKHIPARLRQLPRLDGFVER